MRWFLVCTAMVVGKIYVQYVYLRTTENMMLWILTT